MKTDTLYDDTPNEVWFKILDENKIYHYGESGVFDNIFENSIYNRLKFFDGVKTVLDVGSGWGGPARVMQKHVPDIKVTCVTNTTSQAEYLSKEFDTIVSDANYFSDDKKYDLITFFETYAHFNEDALKNFAKNSDRIVYKDWVSPEYFFNPDWLMHFRTLEQTVNIFDNAGFEIKSCCPITSILYKESYEFWLSNIERFEEECGREVSDDFCFQIKLLKKLCIDEITYGRITNSNLSTYEIYAEKK
jgi:cyclopropane fatty-acyl-phospholipid synthase-like methyltransferase